MHVSYLVNNMIRGHCPVFPDQQFDGVPWFERRLFEFELLLAPLRCRPGRGFGTMKLDLVAKHKHKEMYVALK